MWRQKLVGDSYISGGDILTDARIGAQEGYDRFVLEFVALGLFQNLTISDMSLTKMVEVPRM